MSITAITMDRTYNYERRGEDIHIFVPDEVLWQNPAMGIAPGKGTGVATFLLNLASIALAYEQSQKPRETEVISHEDS